MTPQVTLDVLGLQHERAVNFLLAAVGDLLGDLSPSSRIVDVSGSLLASLEADRAAMPEVHEQSQRLYAEEPYRLKCAFIRQKLLNTTIRAAGRSPHVPGLDYLDRIELIDDLVVMRESLEQNRGGTAAAGVVSRLIRTVATFGLYLATMDVREHSEKHHELLAQLFDGLGELPVAYGKLDRGERFRLLVARAGQPATPAGADDGAAAGPGLHHGRVRRHPHRPRQLRRRDRRELHHLHDRRRRRRAGRRRAGPGGGPGRRAAAAWPGSGSCPCWRPSTSCAGPATSSTTCSATRRTGSWCGCGATSRR